MDRDKLKRELTENFQSSLDQAIEAVEKAPDGQWIAASQWQIREIFQKPMGETFEKVLQAKPGVGKQGSVGSGRAVRWR
jgi:hypothetical protein